MGWPFFCSNFNKSLFGWGSTTYMIPILDEFLTINYSELRQYFVMYYLVVISLCFSDIVNSLVVLLQVQRISDCFCCTGWIDLYILCCLCKFSSFPPPPLSPFFFSSVIILADTEELNLEIIQGWKRRKPSGRFQLSTWGMV